MKITMNELRSLVGKALSEARKKTEKSVEAKYSPKPAGYGYAEAFDFSVPLGAYNLYRSQGAVNWGPMTGPGTSVDDAMMKEFIDRDPWNFLHEASNPSQPNGLWESAKHWYDHQGLGLGHQTAEGIELKKIKLAKQKKQGGK